MAGTEDTEEGRQERFQPDEQWQGGYEGEIGAAPKSVYPVVHNDTESDTVTTMTGLTKIDLKCITDTTRFKVQHKTGNCFQKFCYSARMQ